MNNCLVTHHYRPQTKLRKGNVFTSVCQEFCPQGAGGCLPGGGCPGPGSGVCVSQYALRQTPPPLPADGYCCGRYASYWNAFLLLFSRTCSSRATYLLSTVSVGMCVCVSVCMYVCMFVDSYNLISNIHTRWLT